MESNLQITIRLINLILKVMALHSEKNQIYLIPKTQSIAIYILAIAIATIATHQLKLKLDIDPNLDKSL